MKDVRYSELVFLRERAEGSSKFEHFWGFEGDQTRIVGLNQMLYVEMAATLLEDMYVRFDDQALQLIIARLRRELAADYGCPDRFHAYQWKDPRSALREVLTTAPPPRLRITYRGLRRVEELRDLLLRDRILEPFGVVLSMQYLRKDLEEALRRGADVPVSVIYADMDDFKPINTQFGQAGGDVVMKKYLEIVRDSLGVLGTAYRGVGDEVVGLVIGQAHEHVVELAQKIRQGVGAMRCEHNGKSLSPVTASLGVATTPPESRGLDIETIAEDRKRRAKEAGKNRVVGST